MKIDTLQLKHTLHFADLKLKFNDQPITLIMGDQGTGNKTKRLVIVIGNCIKH